MARRPGSIAFDRSGFDAVCGHFRLDGSARHGSGNRQASRIDVVKAVVGDFVERREGDRLGLILFAAHAYIQASDF